MLTVAACTCLIVGSLLGSEAPNIPPEFIPQRGVRGGLLAEGHCALGVYYYDQGRLVIKIREPEEGWAIIDIPYLGGPADFQYCLGAPTARIGSTLVAVEHRK